MESNNKSPRRAWDLMIGVALIIFGGLRLYNRWQAEEELNFRSLFILLFILYGAYLVYRHFQNPKKN